MSNDDKYDYDSYDDDYCSDNTYDTMIQNYQKWPKPRKLCLKKRA